VNWRLDNPPVIDVEVSRRMGLFVVGRLAARHGIRVRLRQAQPRGVSALVWLPDTVAELETAAPPGSVPGSVIDRFEADASPAAARITAPPSLFPAGIRAPEVTAHSMEPGGWFRRRDKIHSSADGQSPASSWSPGAGQDFHAAHAASYPAVGATSPAGLPTRMPNTHFGPGSPGRPDGQQAEHQAGLTANRQQVPGARHRSPEEARSRLTEFQHGFLHRRPDGPPDFGAEGK
jgi:hypothetical protein